MPDDTAEYAGAIEETSDLEYAIITSRPVTPEGLLVKRRFVAARSEEIESLDVATVVAMLLEADVERMAAAR